MNRYRTVLSHLTCAALGCGAALLFPVRAAACELPSARLVAASLMPALILDLSATHGAGMQAPSDDALTRHRERATQWSVSLWWDVGRLLELRRLCALDLPARQGGV